MFRLFVVEATEIGHLKHFRKLLLEDVVFLTFMVLSHLCNLHFICKVAVNL